MLQIKVQCPCGQRYGFEVEPINGQMPNAVNCPVCGADGTAAANQAIAATRKPSRSSSAILAELMPKPIEPRQQGGRAARPSPSSSNKRRGVLIAVVIVSTLLAWLVIAQFYRSMSRPPKLARPSMPHTSEPEFDRRERPTSPSLTNRARRIPTDRPATGGPRFGSAARTNTPVDMNALSVGEKVEVLWGNKWWVATVLAKEAGGKVRIHYEGHSTTFDESVTPDRIRPKQ